MDAPAAVVDGQIDPFKNVPPARRNSIVPVLVASGRTVSGHPEPDRFYTDDRSREVRLGLATVEIGANLDWEELRRESCAEDRRRDLAMSVVSYEEFGPLWTTAWPPDGRFARHWNAAEVDRGPAERFVAEIESMLDLSERRQVTVFVHGFNTRFGPNLEIAAEFWHYMARDGVMLSFDWPSRGNLFSYHVDKANAEFAVRQFRCLLEFLATSTSADRINIMAHSAGNPIAVEALRQLSLRSFDESDEEARRRWRIGAVVLAAPDMDLGAAMSAGVDGAGRLAQSTAIYASRRDRALDYSGNIFGDVRLGRSIGHLPESDRAAIIANGSQWIDVTAAQDRYPTYLGHSYFHENPWVSSDILLLLALGATPEQRGLVRNTDTGFLEFPDDYEEQLPAIVERITRTREDPASIPN